MLWFFQSFASLVNGTWCLTSLKNIILISIFVYWPNGFTLPENISSDSLSVCFGRLIFPFGQFLRVLCILFILAYCLFSVRNIFSSLFFVFQNLLTFFYDIEVLWNIFWMSCIVINQRCQHLLLHTTKKEKNLSIKLLQCFFMNLTCVRSGDFYQSLILTV